MTRWSPRRAARRSSAPTWPALAAVDLPADCSPDLRDLGRVAVARGGELLSGLAPTERGLLVIHPRSALCPDELAAAGRIVCRVEPLSWLREAGALLRLLAPLQPQPGCYVALLVGEHQAAHLALSSTAGNARRAS